MFVVLIVSKRRGQTVIPSCTVLCHCTGDIPEKFGVSHSSSEELARSVTEKELRLCFFFCSGKALLTTSKLGSK